jgi:hypothetical protein
MGTPGQLGQDRRSRRRSFTRMMSSLPQGEASESNLKPRNNVGRPGSYVRSLHEEKDPPWGWLPHNRASREWARAGQHRHTSIDALSWQSRAPVGHPAIRVGTHRTPRFGATRDGRRPDEDTTPRSSRSRYVQPRRLPRRPARPLGSRPLRFTVPRGGASAGGCLVSRARAVWPISRGTRTRPRLTVGASLRVDA